MACIGEALNAAGFLGSGSPDGTFSPVDVLHRVEITGKNFSESTIRTHVVFRMCLLAPVNHAEKYEAQERIGFRKYRLR
jgi:hypothetical protein